MSIQLLQGDCLEILPTLEAGSVDCILADPPYGTTACKWDAVIPFSEYVIVGNRVEYRDDFIMRLFKAGATYNEAITAWQQAEPKPGMWEQLKRIAKPKAAIVLFGSEPFTSVLITSNIKMYRYSWIWQKQTATNFFFGNKQPLKITEDIAVFYQKQPTYNPQKTPHPKGAQKLGGIKISRNARQLRKSHPAATMSGAHWEPDKLLPNNILKFNKVSRPVHPTQKPVPLMEYLIKTYTNEGETVLDFTFGSGTTGVAAINTNRNFIGIERDPEYFQIAQNRIAAAQEKAKMNLFAA